MTLAGHDAATSIGWGIRARFFFAALALASFCLGYWGLLRYAEVSPTHRTHAADIFYWDLQLFVLSSGPAQEGGSLPWMLQAARFAAPLATAYALVSTAQAIFSDQLARLRARRLTGHTVVCGTEPQAAVLTRELIAAGETVVVIDPGNDVSASSSVAVPEGAHLVVGDARAVDVLQRAGAAQARDVMAVTSDGAFNAEVALAIGGFAPMGALRCYAEIADRQLCAAMARATRASTLRSRSTPIFFSRHDRAARNIIEQATLLRTPPDQASALVVGGGPLAESLVLEIARLWDQRARRGSGALPVVVLASTRMIERQLRRAPLPPGAVDLDVRMAEPTAIVEAGELALAGDGPLRYPTFVFVCLDDDAKAIRVGLTALDLLPDAHVTVAVTSGTVFSEVLYDRLVLHNVIRGVYASRSVRRDSLEEMARAAHSAYVASALAAGEVPPGSTGSLVPWDELPAELQRSNLAQAADIESKVAAIGCEVAPLPTAESFAFTATEVDHLAQLEHARWLREKVAAGWAYGERDNGARLHPDMVEWENLSEQARNKDRDAIREIPDLLRGAGYALVRHRQS